MKKLFKISVAALAAGAAVTLAGCGGCAGCSGNSKNYAPTNSNWYTGTSYKGIQPSFVKDDAHPEYKPEVIDYEVTYSPYDGNSSYTVNYTDGSYRTEFYAEKYFWKDNPVYAEDKEEILYCYKTQFEITVEFTLKSSGAKTQAFKDSAVSVAYFRAAGRNLQPVYSYQKMVSHSPANMTAASLEGIYREVNVVYENFYDYNCTEVTTFTTENPAENYVRDENSRKKHTGLDKLNYSLFDNSSLYIAVRSMKLSPSLSQRICLFNASAGGVSEYGVSGTEAALGETEHAAISAELEKNGLFVPDTEKEITKVPAVAVHLNFVGGDLSGTTQTAWFAAITDADKNIGRTTMLKLSVPLSYGLGTLNYTLKTVQSTLWNGN